MPGRDLFSTNVSQPTRAQLPTLATPPTGGVAGGRDLFSSVGGAAAPAPQPGGISVPSGLSLDITQQPQQPDLGSGDFLSTALEGFEPVRESDWGAAIQETFQNVVPSAQAAMQSGYEGLTDPVGTAAQLGGIVTGGLQEVIPGLEHMMPEERSKQAEELFSLFTSTMKDRYGSVENFKKTAKTDPVGVLLEGASFFVPGGQALRGAGKVTRLKGLQRLGSLTAKAGAAIEPVNIIKSALGKTAGLIPKSVPSKLYQSGLNLSAKLTKAQRQALVATGLRENILPTSAGLDKLRDRVNTLNVGISDLVDRAVAEGKRIPVEALTKDFDFLRQEARKFKFGFPDDALAAVDRAENKIKDAFKSESISPAEAQEVKQNIYKFHKDYYDSIKEAPINVEAQKLLARNLKESLESLFPEFNELKKTNRRDSDLIKLEKELVKSIDDFKMGDIMGAKSLGALTAGLFNRPSTRARLGVILEKLRTKGVFVDPQSFLGKLTIAPIMGGQIGAFTRGAATVPGRLTEDLGGEEAQ